MEISASRQQVSVYNCETGTSTSQTFLPKVFLAPIRPDVVHFVHTNMAKNKRQPYAVKSQHGPSGISAGHQHSAHSWGTGRAVSRIPRVSGSGTQASGQGAVGNMCRGGHMFAPTKVWRKWHKKINKKQRRYATSSALAASALPSLVSARGHSISSVPEIPLVVSNNFESVKKTKEALEVFGNLGVLEDVQRCIKSKNMRAGKGKMRGRRFTRRKGPLVVYKNDLGLVKGLRNIPGVETCSVERLNLLQLAPGAHLGRFIVWTESAFNSLDDIFGTFNEMSKVKKNYVLPRHNILTNTDIARVINSDEVQSVLRPFIAKKIKTQNTTGRKIQLFIKSQEKKIEEMEEE